jgi:cyclopropane-fatty-acyl-phospholipid synthase
MTEVTLHAPQRSDPFRRVLVGSLNRLRDGVVEVADAHGTQTFGAGGPRVRIDVHDPRFYREVVLGGTVGAGEAYMAGHWDCDDLTALVRIMLVNRNLLRGVDGPLSIVRGALDLVAHLRRGNSLRGSRRNIGAHYDLSNAFFETFLDPTLMYSAAVFENDSATLEEASVAKLERLCRKLELDADDHLLEIGTGWGSLAIYAAEHFGCRVTTTTISREQFEAARRRVAERGLQDRITVLDLDYRQLTGTFDKIVSVEMVEAVGHRYLDGYFEQCNRLLKPGGLLVLQAITIEDQRYRRALKTVDFIKKHIFPGSFIPSVSVLVDAAARRTDTVLVNLEDIGADYARTLRCWADAAARNAARITALGFDERFQRMWRFYLAYCEGGFAERSISDVQLVFARSGYRGRPWRARLS